MEMRKQVTKNVFYSTLDNVALSITGYIFWILMARLLIPDELGVVSLIIGIFSFLLPITSLGFGGTLIKFISDLKALGKEGEINNIVYFSWKSISVFSILVGLIFFFFSEQISLIFYSKSNLAVPLQILAFLIVFGSLYSVNKGILTGFQKFRTIFYADFIANVLKVTIPVMLVLMGFGALGGLIGMVVFYFIIVSIFTYLSYRALSKAYAEYKKRDFIFYTFNSSISTAASYLISQGGIILLGFMSQLQSVAYFNIAIFFGLIIQMFINILGTGIAPSISELWAKKDHIRLKLLIETTMKYVNIMTFPIVIAVIFFSGTFISILFSTKYLEAATILPWYLFGYFFFALNSLLWYVLFYTDSPQTMSKLMIFAAIMNIALSIPLIMLYDVLGASIAFLSVQLAMFLLTFHKVSKKVPIKFPYLTKIIMIFAILAVIMYLINSFISDNILIFILVLLSIPIYLVMILKFGVLEDHDLRIIADFTEKYKFLNKIYTMILKLRGNK